MADFPDLLPCRVTCEGGPSFSRGVHTRTLLDYLVRRTEYNKDALEHNCGLPYDSWSREGPSKDCPLCKARADFDDFPALPDIGATPAK